MNVTCPQALASVQAHTDSLRRLRELHTAQLKAEIAHSDLVSPRWARLGARGCTGGFLNGAGTARVCLLWPARPSACCWPARVAVRQSRQAGRGDL